MLKNSKSETFNGSHHFMLTFELLSRYLILNNVYTMTYSGRLGDWYIGLGAPTLVAKKHFSRFLFQLYFNKKYVEVAINDFTMHLIISKLLRRQKFRQKRKIMRRGTIERGNCLQKCFHLLKYIIDTANVCFFF